MSKFVFLILAFMAAQASYAKDCSISFAKGSQGEIYFQHSNKVPSILKAKGYVLSSTQAQTANVINFGYLDVGIGWGYSAGLSSRSSISLNDQFISYSTLTWIMSPDSKEERLQFNVEGLEKALHLLPECE